MNSKLSILRPCPTTRRVTLLALTAVLAACGGGGDDSPCGGAGNLSLDVTYEVNGQLVNPSTTVILTRNAAVLARPQALGLPSACNAAARWTFTARSDVPSGLAFDASTGVITGTPTSLSTFRVELRLKVDGYTAEVGRTINFAM